MSFFQKIVDYIKSTKLEVKNVNWPTKKDTVRLTLLVLGISAAVAAYLGFLDFVFINILEKFVF